MSDSARKRKLADFVVAWKKQVVKLYAVTKWSRDADIVQKCMVRKPLVSFIRLSLIELR
jgi:mediator of RNA polymerase II transcription subunit 14